MLQELNTEILHMKKKVREYNKLRTLRDSIQKELTEKTKERGRLIQEHDKELNDVEILEKTSVRSLFLSITGNREEAIHEEREQLLRAKARYEECQMTIDELKKNLDEANGLLFKFGDIEKDYSGLLKDKERLLVQSGGEQGKELGERLIKADELQVDIREIKEAIAAGKAALQSLEGVHEKLRSAKNWGTWDLLGGGLISNIAKHSAIDEANTRAREVQHQMRLFKKELSDVNQFTDFQVNLSTFASFADFFFDGLIADWFVQSRINDSISHVDDSRSNILNIVQDLEAKSSLLKKDLRNNQKEIDLILQK